jgi:PiT family inorganic phosphate transporter
MPTIPLVPVSSSQAVVGAIIGIGLAKGGHNIRIGVLGRISSGWVATPVISAAIAFVLLFFVQNVFSQRVYTRAHYPLPSEVAAKLDNQGIHDRARADLVDRGLESAGELSDAEQAPPLGLAARRGAGRR